MTSRLPRRVQTLRAGVAAPLRVAVGLLCAAAFFRSAEIHAQGFKQLPDAKEAIPTRPPGPDQLFQLESEPALRERLLEEARRKKAPPPLFPAEPPREAPFAGRFWDHRVTFVEPSYVCYGRLYFQQINAERYGWDLGWIHPLISVGKFYWDVATLPYQLATDPCRCYDCSAGYCLPGSCVPLLCYPPEWSVTGSLAEAAVIAALFLIFP